MRPSRVLTVVVVSILVGRSALAVLQGQSVSKEIREDGLKMLTQVKEDLKTYYYDRTFHGMDLDARFARARDSIERATTTGQVWGIIEQVLFDLNDSHTFFIPPSWTVSVNYGFTVQIIGNKCLVTSVEKGSDAESKGIRIGDEIFSIDGVGLSRENFFKFLLLYFRLRPKTGMKIVIQKPDGSQPEFDVKSKTQKSKEPSTTFELAMHYFFPRSDHERPYKEIGGGAVVWRLRQFEEPGEVDVVMKKIANYESIILDLRNNPGGYEVTLQQLAEHLFEHTVKIADRKRRDSTTPLVAKGRGDRAFKGKLVVLIDSRSASAAEVMARLIQIEKRGVVIGDRSGGYVMGARHFQHQIGRVEILPYATRITGEDLIMSDGKSLEHVGVTPDETVLPTPADLASKRDPALSRAAEIVGVKMDAEKAGKLFKD